MLGITHKGILEVEEENKPEKEGIRRAVLSKIMELTSADHSIFINIDALAGKMNMMRYETFDALNFFHGRGSCEDSLQNLRVIASRIEKEASLLASIWG